MWGPSFYQPMQYATCPPVGETGETDRFETIDTGVLHFITGARSERQVQKPA